MKSDGLDRENRPIKYGLSAADRQKLVERHFEQALLRKAEIDLAMRQAVQLGATFQRLREG